MREIALIDNNVFDGRERTFLVSLSLLESDFQRVCFINNVIAVNIIDDEEPPIVGVCVCVPMCVCAHVCACACVRMCM